MNQQLKLYSQHNLIKLRKEENHFAKTVPIEFSFVTNKNRFMSQNRINWEKKNIKAETLTRA